jgi:hypothetical protein
MLRLLIFVDCLQKLYFVIDVYLLNDYKVFPFELFGIFVSMVGSFGLWLLIRLLPVVVELSLGSSFQDGEGVSRELSVPLHHFRPGKHHTRELFYKGRKVGKLGVGWL